MILTTLLHALTAAGFAVSIGAIGALTYRMTSSARRVSPRPRRVEESHPAEIRCRLDDCATVTQGGREGMRAHLAIVHHIGRASR